MSEVTYATGGKGNARLISWCSNGDGTIYAEGVRLPSSSYFLSQPLKRTIVYMGVAPITVIGKGKIIRIGGRYE